MASGTKKRRKSQSPARGTTSKRARMASSGASNRTQHHEYDSHPSRAGSVKDTYLAPKQGRSISLPTGDDWVFRVKVISSATDLGNDLFKNAVQGLVRICFPEGILDQLGPQVLEQHMREEKAPEQNIQRMSQIFQAEMEQRMASMLAEHLDTAAKVDSVLRTILSASARAHGDSLGENILGYITAGLIRMMTKAPKRSTEWLASGAAATQEEDEGSSDGDSSTSNISDQEPTPPPPKVKISKKRERKTRRARSRTPDDILEEVEVDADLPATLPEQHTSKNKDRKISSKWQWNVDAADLADEDVAEAFPRTSDLFAYHALPISQRKLGPSASKKDIRYEMQSLLDGMPAEEFDKWIESLQKLLNGDRAMLDRPGSDSSSEQQSTRVTPAPVDMRHPRSKPASSSKEIQDPSFPKPGNDDVPFRERTAIKGEAIDDLHTLPYESLPQDRISETTTALRQLSTEEQVVERRASGVEPDDGGSADGFFGTPVVKLLWGVGNIAPSTRLAVVTTIMQNIDHRVPAPFIAVKGLGGTNATCKKTELRNAINRAFPQYGKAFHFGKTKNSIERALIPWVIAAPSSFPELKAMPFVFGNTMSHITIALDAFFGPWSAVSTQNGSQLWDSLLKALQKRGISETSLGSANVDCLQIEKLCDTQKYPERARRTLLERVLRRVVFLHRDNFQEFKTSPVVMTWERMTGLKW